MIGFTKSFAKEVAKEGICVKCRVARSRSNGDFEPDHTGASGLHDATNSHRPHGEAGRDRRSGALPCESGLFVCYGAVVGRERRARDVLYLLDSLRANANRAGVVFRLIPQENPGPRLRSPEAHVRCTV